MVLIKTRSQTSQFSYGIYIYPIKELEKNDLKKKE